MMVSVGLVAPSPYVLKTWSISPDLWVKATWKTGNEREKMEEVYPQTFSRICCCCCCSELFINNYININILKYFIYLFQILQCFMEVWGFQSQKQNLSGKKIKLLFRFMYFLKVKFCLWDFCNSKNQIYLLWQKKRVFCYDLKKKILS